MFDNETIPSSNARSHTCHYENYTFFLHCLFLIECCGIVMDLRGLAWLTKDSRTQFHKETLVVKGTPK